MADFCKLIDLMLGDEAKATQEYAKLFEALGEAKKSLKPTQTWVADQFEETIRYIMHQEQVHHDLVLGAKQTICNPKWLGKESPYHRCISETLRKKP